MAVQTLMKSSVPASGTPERPLEVVLVQNSAQGTYRALGMAGKFSAIPLSIPRCGDRRGFRLGSACLGLVFAAALFGQTSAPADPAATAGAAAAPASPTAFSYKGFNASGYLDIFYNENFNNPASRYSQLQAFNFTSDKLSLNSVTGSFSYDPKPFGFRVDTGYGRTYDAFYMSEPKHTDWSRYLLNAYASFKPASWKGAQLDFGKFVSSAGAEVTESFLNWNYSRSLLFAFGPYYHTGLRFTAPVRKDWTIGAQGVTGWNLMRDNNSGKTMGFTSLNTWGKVTLANNYYTGPENNNTNKGWRNFYDLVVTGAPMGKLSYYFNYDVGRNRSASQVAAPPVSATFWGIAGAARIALNKYFAIAPRLEFYRDGDGFWTGTSQSLKEFTLTAETKLNDSFITRLEYRRDWSDKPFFQVGQIPAQGMHQNMIIVSFIMVVKPGMLKIAR